MILVKMLSYYGGAKWARRWLEADAKELDRLASACWSFFRPYRASCERVEYITASVELRSWCPK